MGLMCICLRWGVTCERPLPHLASLSTNLLKFKFRNTGAAQVLKFLGKGSYGSVLQVQRLGDGQLYALKVRCTSAQTMRLSALETTMHEGYPGGLQCLFDCH